MVPETISYERQLSVSCVDAPFNAGSFFELHPCSRTLGYFTPVHERDTKWDNNEERTRMLSKPRLLIDIMIQERRKATLQKSVV